MSYGPVYILHNSAECNFSKTLTAYTVFHSFCVQNKMFQAVGSIKMRQLENFLTNTCKPHKNIFVDHCRVVGFCIETVFFKLRFNDLTVLVGQCW